MNGSIVVFQRFFAYILNLRRKCLILAYKRNYMKYENKLIWFSVDFYQYQYCFSRTLSKSTMVQKTQHIHYIKDADYY